MRVRPPIASRTALKRFCSGNELSPRRGQEGSRPCLGQTRAMIEQELCRPRLVVEAVEGVVLVIVEQG